MGVLSNNFAQIVPGAIISASYVSDIYDVLMGAEREDVMLSGSLNVTGSIYGNLIGTASIANTASYALFTDYVTISSSYADSVGTASLALNAISASYAAIAQTASYVETAQTASYVTNAVSSSYALSASYVPGIPSFNLVNTIFVSPSGSDVTGTIGDISKPYQNLYTARNAASSGSLIYVFPGTWSYDNTNAAGNPYNGQIDSLVNLWKDNTYYYFSPGSKIFFYNQTVTGNDMYLFKSPGSGSTCIVRGDLEFSGSSTGADSFGGAVVFYEPGIGDGCTFDCEVKSLTSKSHLIGTRGNTITGSTSIIKITADEINYTHTGNNVGQSGIGAPIVIRSTSDAQYYINARKVRSTYYRAIQIRDLTTSSIAVLNINCIQNLGSNDAIVCEVNACPNIIANIDRCEYVGRPYETSANLSTFKFIGNINWYEVGDVGIASKFTFGGSSQGTTILNGYYNFKYNRLPFSSTTSEKIYVNGTINFETANFTNVIFQNAGSGEINFNGNITGNFQGVVARPRTGKIIFNDSNIIPSITGGLFISNDTTTTGTLNLKNTYALFNSTSDIINGQYVNLNLLNSQIKNLGTSSIIVNTTPSGSIQLHNSLLITSGSSTINITGVAPLVVSNTTSNTAITASVIYGTITELTEANIS